VAVDVPEWMDGVGSELSAPVERPHLELGDTGIGVHRLVDNRFWQEAVLVVEDGQTLLVPEAVGTAPFFLASGERLGVHPMLRLKPPRSLLRFDPETVLVGHGPGVSQRASEALEDAITGARRRTPSLVGRTAKRALWG
jgi:hypothetical protein